MASQSVTLNLPDILYERVRQRAEQMHRSVEAELLEVVVSGVPLEDELPTDLIQALAPLDFLDNTALYKIARRKLSKQEAAQIEKLHLKRQREDLSETEIQTLAALIGKYDKVFLMRTQAINLLFQRGQDISEFSPKQLPKIHNSSTTAAGVGKSAKPLQYCLS